MTSEEGGKIISNGWKAAFITEAIEKGSKSLNLVDLFYKVVPWTTEVNEMFEVIPDNQDDISSFATQSIHDYEEWEKGELLNNILKYLMTSNKIICIFFLKEELSSKYFYVHIHEQ